MPRKRIPVKEIEEQLYGDQVEAPFDESHINDFLTAQTTTSGKFPSLRRTHAYAQWLKEQIVYHALLHGLMERTCVGVWDEKSRAFQIIPKGAVRAVNR
jgi:hypothetical protein